MRALPYAQGGALLTWLSFIALKQQSKVNLSGNSSGPGLSLTRDTSAASRPHSATLGHRAAAERPHFHELPRGHQDFVIRTFSTRFPALQHWHATCHSTPWISIVPTGSLCSFLLKEDMGRGYTVFARSWKRKNFRYRIASTMVLALAGVAAVLMSAPESRHEDKPQEVPAETLAKPSFSPLSFELPIPSASDTNRGSNRRPVYPYSIIPGGIRSVEELKIAIVRDPVVKAHYRDFNLRKAHMVRLTKDRAVHVSYRRGDKIYWTKRKLKIYKGETVITDGEHMSRTRCANRITDRPTPPHSPDEPPPVDFDRPLDPPVFPPPPPPLALLPPPGGSFPVVPFVPIFPGGGGSPPVGHKPPEPVRVPEPSALCLLMVTLPVVWLSRKRGRS